MSDRTWKIATAGATTAFVATAVWGVVGWTRPPPPPDAQPTAELTTELSPPQQAKQTDRTNYIGNIHNESPASVPRSGPPTTEITDNQLDLAREIVQQEYKDERDERRVNFVDDIHNALQRFADDEQVDSETRETIVDIFETSMEFRRSQRELVESGDRTRWEARQAIRDHRQGSEDRLIDLVGEDGMARLQDTLPGWGARRSRPAAR
jgi:hypothetical protein